MNDRAPLFRYGGGVGRFVVRAFAVDRSVTCIDYMHRQNSADGASARPCAALLSPEARS